MSDSENRRPLMTPEDIRAFSFMLAAMRDDRERSDAAECYDARYDAAEDLAKRILGSDYRPPAGPVRKP